MSLHKLEKSIKKMVIKLNNTVFNYNDKNWMKTSVDNIRNKLIKYISKYDIETVNQYEKLIEKRYWNLININGSKYKCYKVDFPVEQGSFIHNIIDNNYFATKKCNNYTDLYNQFRKWNEHDNKLLFEAITLIKPIVLNPTYYPYFYVFPNLNPCFIIKDNEKRLDRIRKMYYSNDDTNWYQINI
jgi:hypothetical protein